MKYAVKKPKSLAVALKELEPFVRNGKHLRTGKPFKKFGDRRSREMLANWLLCAAVSAIDNRELTFTSDPVGGDGIICDPATGETWPTEHVMVPPLPQGEAAVAEALILKAVESKRSKGDAAYAVGKTLVVFLDAGAGEWFSNRVVRQLPAPLLFAAVWVVGLHDVEDGAYLYNVVSLDKCHRDTPVLRVQIDKSFDTWSVVRVQ